MIPGISLDAFRSQVALLKQSLNQAQVNGDVDMAKVPGPIRSVINEAIGHAGTKKVSTLSALVDQAATIYEKSNKAFWLAGVNPVDNLMRLLSLSERGDAALQNAELLSARFVLEHKTNQRFASSLGVWIMLGQ